MNWWHNLGFIIVVSVLIAVIAPWVARWVNEWPTERVAHTPRPKPLRPTLDDFFAEGDDDAARQRIMGF